jgi:RNA polymerase primary sigma factor
MDMEGSKLINQSDRIQRLLEEADQQGYLTLDRLLEAFPEAEQDLARLEDLFDILCDQGIQICEGDDESQARMAQTEEASGENGDRTDVADLSGVPVDDSIGLYLTEVRQVPLLSREEEVTLAKQLERGQEASRLLANDGRDSQEKAQLKRLIEQGQRARDRLIQANTRLVVSVAKRYRGLGLPFQDLIQAGNVGLIRAVDRFDPRRGYKLGTYATWWIRQAVTRALSQHGRTIRIPVYMSDRIRRVHRVAQQLEQDLGRRPTPEEIAEAMDGLRPSSVRWMLRVSQRPMSLDKPVGDGEGVSEFGDFVEDEDVPSPAQRTERHLLREDLREMLAALPPREARVLRLRFGLDGDRGYTLKEVGEKLGVTRERARQIACKALRKLRHPRHSRKLRDYLS